MEKLQIINSSADDLKAMAQCHRSAFPKSLSSKLGLKYCKKMLQWYIVSPNRFLFHLQQDNTIIGYCGGFIRNGEQHGSSTGMTQHAFRQGIFSLLSRPWLLLHPEIKKNYRFLQRNLLLRFKGNNAPKSKPVKDSTLNILTAGLVVIGVEPASQGKQYGKLLLEEFEHIARIKGAVKLILSVKKNNEQAIKSYLKNGWLVGKSDDHSQSMYKNI